MAPLNLAPLDFSRTQRLVLLVDLHPFLVAADPSFYIDAVTSIAERIFHFPPLSTSLSAFKLFFSSLSSTRSAATLPRYLSTQSLSFNLPLQTLDTLSATLNSISVIANLHDERFSSNASYVASSLIQLINDCAWETEKDNLLGEDSFIDGEFMKIHSNLVILLSPISQSIDNFDMRDFDEVYCAVKEAFVMRDIRLCWVDVKGDAVETEVADIKKNESRDMLINLRNYFEKMGWGFCSGDFIVLGSALLPLGLIYPRIGVSFKFADYAGNDKRESTGELILEILDVHGMPLECKFCDLEFVSLNNSTYTTKDSDILNGTQFRDRQSLYGQDGVSLCLVQGRVKVHVKSVHRYDEYEITGGFPEVLLVHEFGKNETKSGNGFLTDSVLDTLHKEMCGVACMNQQPTWQMFLNFLHINGYSAVVAFSSSNGDALMGCLKPLTAHLAIIYIMDGSHIIVRNTSGCNVGSLNIDAERINEPTICSGSQTNTSASGNCSQHRDAKMKKSQKNLYQQMTWDNFSKAAFQGSKFNLFEFYLARYEKSKRLKFLACWMKQVKKVDVDLSTALAGPGSKLVGELDACNAFSSEPYPAEDEVRPVLNSDALETLFNNLHMKMKHGLESGMDLQNLAEHVVKSSVHLLNCNREIGSNSKYQQSLGISSDSSSGFGGRLVEQLLKPLKAMKKIHQDLEPSSSENIVREYELQIFLRIEILKSDEAAILGVSRKKKLVKQICSMLEITQYLVEGGIHGHVSLYDYVERTVRSRYSNEFDDIVNMIYLEMELLPFGDEEQSPSFLFNSEDSNQSWRDKYEHNDKNEINNMAQSFSTEGETSQLPTNHLDNLQMIRHDEYSQIVNEAHESREKARRRAPFVGKARDLQRVWAPKLLKAKAKLGPAPKKPKRKKNARKRGCSSVVYETPLSGDKRDQSGENGIGNKMRGVPGSSSVSKALFQDN